MLYVAVISNFLPPCLNPHNGITAPHDPMGVTVNIHIMTNVWQMAARSAIVFKHFLQTNH